jgi:lytic murein transglycosylase
MADQRFWAAWRRLGGVGIAVAFLTGTGAALAQQARPEPAASTAQTIDAGFERFIESLWPQARARGVSRGVFDAAFRGVTPDPKVLALSQKQSEFVRPVWDYIAGAASPARIAKGQEIARDADDLLDAIESHYGVPRGIVLGIWGMETNFGGFTGNIYVIRALATLAFSRYRGDFFKGELLTALEILEGAHVLPSAMLGSWAGAMGQTQFMPSSFLKYAVDGDGNGRRDIWSSMTDSLASTANYLHQKGWKPGLPWGFEVTLPEGFDFRHHRHGFDAWARLGLRRADGNAMLGAGEATLFMPAGARGPAFLVTENFQVIKSYNSSDAYALGVAHLGDRIYSGQPIRTAWPTNEPSLDPQQRAEVQKRLNQLGLYDGSPDGKLGSKTRDAVRQLTAVRIDRGWPCGLGRS